DLILTDSLPSRFWIAVRKGPTTCTLDLKRHKAAPELHHTSLLPLPGTARILCHLHVQILQQYSIRPKRLLVLFDPSNQNREQTVRMQWPYRSRLLKPAPSSRIRCPQIAQFSSSSPPK